MGSTGHKASTSGIYQSDCTCKLQIALSEGETFPPCGVHGAVGWTLIQATKN
jgi:hypothetical protein